MKQNYWETKTFQKIQKDWYERLEKEGFKDIEANPTSDNSYLTQHHLRCVDIYQRGKNSGGEYYYSMAAGWYWHGKFDDEWDRWVWLKHAEGFSEREIVKELNKPEVKHKCCSRFPVHNAIDRVKNQMFNSAWYINHENDGYLSPYDTSTQIYGEFFNEQ